MTAAFEEVPFSDLLHRPAATAGMLDNVRALRLRRRDADDLALMRVSQLESDGLVVDFAAHILAVIVRRFGIATLREVLPDALPWAKFLPESDLDLFAHEVVEVAQGAAALDNLAPLATLLIQWRHSAEIYADPALLAILTSEPDGDFGPVIPPDPEGI